MEQAGSQRAGDGTGQRGGDPDAGVLDDVAHLQHTGAQTLTDKAAYTVLLVAHHGKAHHLGAAARHGSAACKAGQTQCGADSSGGDGQGQCHAHDDRHQNAHDQRSLLGGPHNKSAHLTCGCTDRGGDEHGKPDARKDGHQRGDKDIHLGLLAYRLAQLCRHDGNDEHSQRAACTAQRIGRVAHGDQAEQHQRRAVQCPADGTSHGGAAHGRSIAAQIHQQCKTGLLTHRLDDGADEQTGEQALCHCAQRINEVTLRRDDDILPHQKFFQLRHKTCLSIQNRSLRLQTYVLYHTIHLSRQQGVAGKIVKFRLCAMFCPAGTYSIWNIFRHTAPVENLCRSPLCR